MPSGLPAWCAGWSIVVLLCTAMDRQRQLNAEDAKDSQRTQKEFEVF
jgi:hypothetical protein